MALLIVPNLLETKRPPSCSVSPPRRGIRISGARRGCKANHAAGPWHSLGPVSRPPRPSRHLIAPVRTVSRSNTLATRTAEPFISKYSVSATAKACLKDRYFGPKKRPGVFFWFVIGRLKRAPRPKIRRFFTRSAREIVFGSNNEPKKTEIYTYTYKLF